MFHSSNQFPIQPMALSVQDPSAPMQVDQNDNSLAAGDEMQNGGLSQAKSIIQSSERLQDDLRLIGLKIKQHEDNLKLLNSQKNKLEESILDMRVILGKYHSSSAPRTENEDYSDLEGEQKVIENILKHEKSAARIICQLSHDVSHASHSKLNKDVLGIVATLGKVDDENLSKLLAEYLGLETMLAIVCKTFEGVKALETFDKDGVIDKSAGLHGLAASLGKPLDARFLVICLENLRPYAGDFIADDPQKRLDLLKPRLPNGECPPGFLGFAVNMINVDSSNLFYVIVGGYGLRETLFYSLFSRLQVYKTRADMVSALPCISEGAVSLDGAIIRSNGIFSLGSREEVDVRFPKPSSMPDVPQSHIQAEKQIKEMNMKKENLQEDIKREEALLNKARFNFGSKKQEYVMFIAQSSSSYTTQHQLPVTRDRLTPR
ncbi:hypothetical protein SLE2022_287370 [Rubroshorea leprosula]